MGDGFDLDAGFGEELDGFFHRGVVLGFELEDDVAGAGRHLGAADVEDHVDRLGHLVDDRFFDEVLRENEFNLLFRHDELPNAAGYGRNN